jgi:hypothetical protein
MSDYSKHPADRKHPTQKPDQRDKSIMPHHFQSEDLSRANRLGQSHSKAVIGRWSMLYHFAPTLEPDWRLFGTPSSPMLMPVLQRRIADCITERQIHG